MIPRVGIYQDLRNPPRWRRPWAAHYQACIERVRYAEACGLDSVWFTEHHLFDDGYMPQQFVYAGAVAARTSRIRLGTAIAIAPLYPALDIAEKAACIDVLSNGRFRLGLGSGYRRPEFEAFGRGDVIDKKFRLLEERAFQVRDLLGSASLVPGPVQDEIPLWIAGFGPRGAGLAGRLGAGLLWLSPELLEPYRAGLTAGGHDASSARMGGLVQLMLARDPERAWQRLKPFLEYQMSSYVRYGAEGTTDSDDSGVKYLADEALVDADMMRSEGPVMLPPAFDVVTPVEAARRLRQWFAHLPVEEIFFWDSIGGMPEDLSLEHIALLAELKDLLRAAG